MRRCIQTYFRLLVQHGSVWDGEKIHLPSQVLRIQTVDHQGLVMSEEGRNKRCEIALLALRQQGL